jgi:FMN-dependent NADH-azoreductase
MAAQDVGSGKLFHHHLHPTRTEEDFLDFIKATIDKFPQQDEVVLLTDQLNTHMSASLVQWIAVQVGFKEGLGKKGHKGILKDMQSRKTFLEDPRHRIRFVYTPKHCS